MNENNQLAYRALKMQEFEEWAKQSKERTVVLMGSPPQTPDGVAESIRDEWMAYTRFVSDASGFWNLKTHGAFAILSVTPEWLEGAFYYVPEELVTEGENRYYSATGGGHRVKCNPKEAIEQAIRAGTVEKRFAWPEDADHPLRVASRNYAETREWQRWREHHLKEAVGTFISAHPGLHLVPIHLPGTTGASR